MDLSKIYFQIQLGKVNKLFPTVSGLFVYY